VTKIFNFKKEWGGEDTWYTKSKRWASKQKFPIDQLALSLIEWIWEKYVDIRVEREMETVNSQAEKIVLQWEKEEKEMYGPKIKSEPSEVEGLDIISISTPGFISPNNNNNNNNN
jgi:hypothetical protein